MAVFRYGFARGHSNGGSDMNKIVDNLVQFIGDTHRPVALLIVAIGFFWAVVNKSDAVVLAAIGAVLGGLYWGKSAENIANNKADPPKPLATQ